MLYVNDTRGLLNVYFLKVDTDPALKQESNMCMYHSCKRQKGIQINGLAESRKRLYLGCVIGRG